MDESISSAVPQGGAGIQNGFKDLAFKADSDCMHFLDNAFDLLRGKGRKCLLHLHKAGNFCLCA